MIDRYGEPLFRVPVEIAASCPHGRCTFCPENGSRAQQTQRKENPLDQAEEAIRFAKRRYKAKKFMLYIQAFTANLTDPKQQNIILDLLDRFDFTAISIGTRPDCLPEEALDFLESLPVEAWVELGVQTADDETLKQINRGHGWECSRRAILKLAERGIHVAPHVILGLPREDSHEWKQAEPALKHFSTPRKRTAEELAKLPISGIKIHNLHVIKRTALATEYATAPFPLLSHWEYAEALMDFLRRIPAHIPVMRISTDTPEDQLVAPRWHLEKGQFLDYVIQQMCMREITQGDLTNGGLECERFEKSTTPPLLHSITPIPTADGSVTFFSEDWKEHYHTQAGARLEAEKKFVGPSGLQEKIQTSNLQLLDVCFGLGNNSLAALYAGRGDRNACSTTDRINKAGKNTSCTICAAGTPVYHSIDITALEMDKRIVRAASEYFQPLESDPMDWNDTLLKLLDGPVEFPNLGKIDLRFGDARYLIQNIKNNVYDVIFHDPFSSQHCPELWTVEFFQQLHRVMKPDGVLLTYSSSMPVRGAMREAGFYIAETNPGHRMGNGTAASPSPLSSHFHTIGSLNERKSIPYHDPYLCATSKTILRARQNALESTRAE